MIACTTLHGLRKLQAKISVKYNYIYSKKAKILKLDNVTNTEKTVEKGTALLV